MAHGLSLVELLVSLALGLVVIAAAMSLLVAAMRSQQHLALEGRLLGELRMAHDTVSRSLRRAGHWAGAASSVAMGNTAGIANPLALVTTADTGNAVAVHYSRDAIASTAATPDEQVGFRLRAGVLQAQIGAGPWQALTDADSLVVTRFQVMPRVRTRDLGAACATECPAGSTTCPPRILTRSADIEITGRSVADPALVRSVHGAVGIRNDAIVGACAP